MSSNPQNHSSSSCGEESIWAAHLKWDDFANKDLKSTEEDNQGLDRAQVIPNFLCADEDDLEDVGFMGNLEESSGANCHGVGELESGIREKKLGGSHELEEIEGGKQTREQQAEKTGEQQAEKTGEQQAVRRVEKQAIKIQKYNAIQLKQEEPIQTLSTLQVYSCSSQPLPMQSPAPLTAPPNIFIPCLSLKKIKKNTNIPKFLVRLFLKYSDQAPTAACRFNAEISKALKKEGTTSYNISHVLKILDNPYGAYNRRLMSRILRQNLKDQIIANNYIGNHHKKSYMIASKIYALRCRSHRLIDRVKIQ